MFVHYFDTDFFVGHKTQQRHAKQGWGPGPADDGQRRGVMGPGAVE